MPPVTDLLILDLLNLVEGPDVIPAPPNNPFHPLGNLSRDIPSCPSHSPYYLSLTSDPETFCNSAPRPSQLGTHWETH